MLVSKDLEIERLQAIVDKLWKSADGIPIVDGMKLYQVRYYSGGGPYMEEIEAEMAASTGDYYDPSNVDLGSYYSTPEAAEKCLYQAAEKEKT